MPWTVRFHPDFDQEFKALRQPVQDELLARLMPLKEFGPMLGRPHVDTLKGSSFGNMKELRFQLDGVWRFAFAFDTARQAIILCGGDKEGARQKEFYHRLIETADKRFAAHLSSLKTTLKQDNKRKR